MLRVRIVYTGLVGLPGVSTLYFEGTGQAAADAAAEAVETFLEFISPGIANELTSTIDPIVDQLEFTTGEITDFLSVANSPVAGTSAAEVLPLATQGNLRLSTVGVVAGRRVLGRIFIPGMTEALSTDGRVSTAAQSDISLSALQSLGDLPEGNRQVVWSRPVQANAGADPPVLGRAGTVHEVTGWVLQPDFAVLTSRRD